VVAVEVPVAVVVAVLVGVALLPAIGTPRSLKPL